VKGEEGEGVEDHLTWVSPCVAGPLLGCPVWNVRVDILSVRLGTGTSLAMLSTCVAQATSKVGGKCPHTTIRTTNLAPFLLTVGPSKGRPTAPGTLH